MLDYYSGYLSMDSKDTVSSRHKRSKSDSERRADEAKKGALPQVFLHPKLDMGNSKGQNNIKKNAFSIKKNVPTTDTEVRSCLKQEILQLEKRLKDQLVERHVLEKALGHGSCAIESANNGPIAKPTKELIREIALLELEVMHLEQYLLSLYRKAFDQQTSTTSPTKARDRLKQPLSSKKDRFEEVTGINSATQIGKPTSQSHRRLFPQKSTANVASEACSVMCPEKLVSPGAHRSQSSLSYRSARISPSSDNLARALQSFHSQPLSFLEDEESANSGLISLAEYLGTTIADHVTDTPNKVSEDMVRCMAAIYCKLADPPLVHQGISSSPTSSFSSMSAVSPQYLGDMWSPGCRVESCIDSRLINPFRVEGLKEFSGPYNSMVEIPLICVDNRRLTEVKDMLQKYKSLTHQLETVDLRRMKTDEKLAFWINIHNALMMHVYLEHGIPHSSIKKSSMLTKATCIVGGRSINVDTIQRSILGCHTHRPGQWHRTILSPRMKIKAGDEWKAQAIKHQEPLLHFALCSGSHSDPAVRIYTPKRLFQQLEAAKEEYIRAAVSIWKEEKILLPKVINSYAKDKGLSSQGIVDMIQLYLPETLRMAMQRCQQGKSRKIVEWVPHNTSFRYLLSRELAIL